MPAAFCVRVFQVWKAAQVELQGAYSIDRLFRARGYCRQTSVAQSFVVLALTPIPCLFVSLSIECIPLQDPKLGADLISLFWLRAFLVTQICAFLALLLCCYLIPSLPTSVLHLLITASVAALCTIPTVYVISTMVGFPVPFTLLLGSPVNSAVLIISGWIMWGRFIMHNPDARKDLINYVLIIATQLLMIYAYPAYTFVFGRLSGLRQVLFTAMLPVIKLVAKNWISYLYQDKHDLKSDMIVLNVDVYHSIFVSWCMNGRSSIFSTMLLMSMDLVEALISLHDIRELFGRLESALEISGFNQFRCRPRRRNRGRINTPNDDQISVLDLAMAFWEGEKSAPNFLEQGNALIQFPVGYRSTTVVPLDSPKTIFSTRGSKLGSHTPQRNRTFSPIIIPVAFTTLRKGSTFRDLPFNRSLSRHAIVPAKLLQDVVNRMSAAERRQCLDFALRLLHLSEFLLLIEFVEMIIPTIYGVYLTAIYYLPNRAYFDTIRDLNDNELRSDLANVAIYALLELLSLLALMHVLQQKLGIAPVKQLAFVLESQWQLAQTKLVLWVTFAVQSRLEHFGTDFTFRFNWLSRS